MTGSIDLGPAVPKGQGSGDGVTSVGTLGWLVSAKEVARWWVGIVVSRLGVDATRVSDDGVREDRSSINRGKCKPVAVTHSIL
jgi:hypothetical protein